MTTLVPEPTVARRPAPARGFDWATLLVVLAGTFMTFLDFFVVNVALPSMQAELHAGPDAVQLVVAGFALAFAVGMISGGRLGDLYGRRRLFAVGLALFTLTSAACGLAPTAQFLVIARVLQGGAGALMTPQVLAIVSTAYTGERRARAFAAYGLTMGFAGVLGQLIGGALIEANIAGTGWRAIFLINVPVGLAALARVRRDVPESYGERTSLDVVGTGLVTAGLVAVVLPLVEGREHGWPLWSWISLAAAPVLLVAFVLHQRGRSARGSAPLVNLGVFRDRTFSVSALTGVMFGGVPAAFFFVLALYLQQGRGFSPLFSGAVFSAVGAGYFAAMLGAQRLAGHLGRQVLCVGALAVAAGSLLLADVASAASSLGLVPGLAVAGFGIGMVLLPLSATALRNVDPMHAGAASGVLSTALQVGGAVSVAVFGVVFYAALGTVTHAFRVSLMLLAVVTLATAATVQLLPRQESR